MINPGVQSDSEFEGEQAEIELPHDMNKRGGLKGQKTKIRNIIVLLNIQNGFVCFLGLLEIGPRMTLKLVKIEEGMDAGEVLFHSFVQKTPKEIDALRRAAPMIRYYSFIL
jgi:ribosome biogenesis protein SSF1/2